MDVDEEWRRVGSFWALRITVRLLVDASEFMPSQTTWHIVLEDVPSNGPVHIFPDAENGIKVTFPHQDANGEPEAGRPWRPGKPCLERPHAVINRNGNDDEPEDLAGRLEWHMWRLLRWIDAAADGTLLRPGDPLELPIHAQWNGASAIAFAEGPGSAAEWAAVAAKWGFARLAVLPGAKDTLIVTEFLDERGALLRKSWKSPGDESKQLTAAWVLLPTIPVLPPWQIPRTWGDLVDWGSNRGVDLPGIVLKASGQRLFRKQAQAARTLLLGFPVSEHVGDEPDRMHWLAITGLRLGQIKSRRTSFGPKARGASQPISTVQRSDSLKWWRTENWAGDQVRRRGPAADDLQARKVLVLGCGALGSTIADSLIRSGVVGLGLVDQDTMRIGNLCRHTLSMSSIGRNKAEALAVRLNDTQPDAAVVAYPTSFPPSDRETREAMASYDIVVDCTAEDQVLNDMASFDWGGEKRFFSFSMTWAAKALLAFSASETGFPAVDARMRFAATARDAGDMDGAQMEGIGCWNPVFPASADDVMLWGAIATKFIREQYGISMRRFARFERLDNGSVAVSDA